MDNLEKIGSVISKIKTESPENLPERIVLAVEKKASRAAKIRVFVFGFASLASISLFYFAAKAALGEFNNNGIFQMLSLIFSDFQSVVANSGNYLMSIAESFPVLPTVYALLSVTVFGTLVGLAVNNVQKFQELKLNYSKHVYKHS